MRAGVLLTFLSTVAAVEPGTALAAVDHDQFCKAMVEIARVGNLDAGRWLDRNTRDDGIEVFCDMRTVNFRRFIKVGPDGSSADWRQRKGQEWNSTACSSAVLREAIDGGWIITTVLTVTSGQRVLLIATCK
jgi:hypothetical protein